MTDVFLDLFGDPVRAERGRGRPALIWDQRTSNKINLLFSCGRSEADVAAVVGHCIKTLKQVYFQEWATRKIAALKFRSVQLERLNGLAADGNVAAEKALAGMLQAERIAATADRVRERGKPAPALGKKEAAKKAAGELGGIYGPRKAPEGLLVQ